MTDSTPEPAAMYEALCRLNALRSAIVHTQSATWSNACYPLVAVLDDLGFEVLDLTDDDCVRHLLAYGGAGKLPPDLGPARRQSHQRPVMDGTVSLIDTIRDRQDRLARRLIGDGEEASDATEPRLGAAGWLLVTGPWAGARLGADHRYQWFASEDEARAAIGNPADYPPPHPAAGRVVDLASGTTTYLVITVDRESWDEIDPTEHL